MAEDLNNKDKYQNTPQPNLQSNQIGQYSTNEQMENILLEQDAITDTENKDNNKNSSQDQIQAYIYDQSQEQNRTYHLEQFQTPINMGDEYLVEESEEENGYDHIPPYDVNSVSTCDSLDNNLSNSSLICVLDQLKQQIADIYSMSKLIHLRNINIIHIAQPYCYYPLINHIDLCGDILTYFNYPIQEINPLNSFLCQQTYDNDQAKAIFLRCLLSDQICICNKIQDTNKCYSYFIREAEKMYELHRQQNQLDFSFSS